MKQFLFISAILAVALLCSIRLVTAQNKPDAAKYEYAIVKWDGPDRLYYNMPDKFEMVHISKYVGIPNEAQQEEWCLAHACNKMAAEGWEPVNLDSRRIVFRRAR